MIQFYASLVAGAIVGLVGFWTGYTTGTAHQPKPVPTHEEAMSAIPVPGSDGSTTFTDFASFPSAIGTVLDGTCDLSMSKKITVRMSDGSMFTGTISCGTSGD